MHYKTQIAEGNHLLTNCHLVSSHSKNLGRKAKNPTPGSVAGPGEPALQRGHNLACANFDRALRDKLTGNEEVGYGLSSSEHIDTCELNSNIYVHRYTLPKVMVSFFH